MNRTLSLLILCFASSALLADITQSIVPTVASAERGELFEPAKYSDQQGAQIRDLLSHTDEKVRIVSYNVLFTRYEHQSPREQHWTARRDKVVTALNAIGADVICVQEMLYHQLLDVQAAIGHRYGFYGRGSNDGMTRGEVNGIFYLKERLALVAGEVIWLTETPNVPSRDPHGKAHTLTVAALQDLRTGRCFQVANTHVAFGSVNSRNCSVNMIASIAAVRSAVAPLIICGDFNAFPQYPVSAYPFLDGDHIERTLVSGPMRNAEQWALLGRYGPQSTYTNATPADTRPFRGTGTPGVMLDRVYFSPGVTVLVHAVDPIRVDGSFPSDHMPVFVDVLIHGR